MVRTNCVSWVWLMSLLLVGMSISTTAVINPSSLTSATGSIMLQTDNGDINVFGTQLAAKQAIAMDAGRDVNTDAVVMEEQHKRSKFGFSGLSVGKTTTKWNDHNVALTTMEAGSIDIHANRDINAAGTLFTAHTGDIRVHGDRTTNIDMVQTTEYLKSHGWNVGLTASMGGFAGSVINTDVANAALKGEDLATAIRQQSPLLDSLNTLSKSKGTLGTGMSIINVASQATLVSKAMERGATTGDALFGSEHIGITASAFSQKQTWQENYPSIFNAPEGTVSLTSGKGTNILGGAKVTAGKDIVLDAGTGKLLISAGPAESTSKGRSGGASLTFGGGGVSIGANYAQNKGNGTTYDPAQFNAGNTLYIKAGNGADLLGVQGIAKHIATDIKGDFNLVTLQNEYKSKNSGIGASISFCGAAPCGGSLNVSGGNTNRHFSDNISQLIGTQSVVTNVTGNTNLVGSTIAQGNYDQKGTFHDGGNLILNTGTLTYSDLKDKDSSFQGGITIGTGFDPKTGITSGGTFGGNIDYSNVEGSTKATIGQGKITTTGAQTQDITQINRDVNTNQIITKHDEERGEITIPLKAITYPKAFAQDVADAPKIIAEGISTATVETLRELKTFIENATTRAEVSDAVMPVVLTEAQKQKAAANAEIYKNLAPQEQNGFVQELSPIDQVALLNHMSTWPVNEGNTKLKNALLTQMPKDYNFYGQNGKVIAVDKQLGSRLLSQENTRFQSLYNQFDNAKLSKIYLTDLTRYVADEMTDILGIPKIATVRVISSSATKADMTYQKGVLTVNTYRLNGRASFSALVALIAHETAHHYQEYQIEKLPDLTFGYVTTKNGQPAEIKTTLSTDPTRLKDPAYIQALKFGVNIMGNNYISIDRDEPMYRTQVYERFAYRLQNRLLKNLAEKYK